MANFLTDSHRNGAVRYPLSHDLNSITLKGAFIDNATSTVLVTHDFLNDVVAGIVPTAGQASCPSLASKTFGSLAVGVFDATDLVFSSLSGNPVEQFVIFYASGTDATSDLFASWDVTLTPNGGDVTVVFNASGIWKF